MSRRSREIQTRENYVLEAARSVLENSGVDGCTMNLIASEAEYTRRTLYSYFKGRDEILLLLHLANKKERIDLQAQAVGAVDDGFARLKAWGLAFFKYAQRHPAAFELQLYWDYKGVDPAQLSEETFTRFKKQNDVLADQLKAIFSQCREEGLIRADLDLDMCLTQFAYAFRGILNRVFSDAYTFGSFDSEDYVICFLDLFQGGITASKANKM